MSKDVDAEEDSAIVQMLQRVAVPILGNVSHVFMHGLNRVHIYGAEKLREALLHRTKNNSLLTVSNHVSSLDDPLVIASLLPRSVIFEVPSTRWTLCATDRCFKNSVTSAFFQCVKVLPVNRGDGIYQKGMDMAISKLNSGGWVHIFPEGTRSRDGGKTMGAAKRGVGRLILDADHAPIVVPFVHTGMQDIVPIGAVFPRIGKSVTVLIGDPICFDDLLTLEKSEHVPRGQLYDAVSSRIGERLRELKVQVDKLALQLELQYPPQRNTDRAAEMLQQVDWESFGMDGYLLQGNDYTPSLRELQPQAEPVCNFSQEPVSEQHFIISFSNEGGIVSRIHSNMDPTEQMGFAARALFRNHWVKERSVSLRQINPLKVWKQFLEANLLQQLTPV